MGTDAIVFFHWTAMIQPLTATSTERGNTVRQSCRAGVSGSIKLYSTSTLTYCQAYPLTILFIQSVNHSKYISNLISLVHIANYLIAFLNLLLFFLATRLSLHDLSSPTTWELNPCRGQCKQGILTTGTTREFPQPLFKSALYWEFPGGLVVRIPSFHCCGPGSIPGEGTEISQAVRRGQKNLKK